MTVWAWGHSCLRHNARFHPASSPYSSEATHSIQLRSALHPLRIAGLTPSTGSLLPTAGYSSSSSLEDSILLLLAQSQPVETRHPVRGTGNSPSASVEHSVPCVVYTRWGKYAREIRRLWDCETTNAVHFLKSNAHPIAKVSQKRNASFCASICSSVSPRSTITRVMTCLCIGFERTIEVVGRPYKLSWSIIRSK